MIRTCLQPGWQPATTLSYAWKEMTPPKQGSAPAIETANQIKDEPMARMWVNDLLVVSASPGRLVMSYHDYVVEEAYARDQVFKADQDEPAWEWRRGSDKVEVAKAAGALPRQVILPPRYIWHYLDQKADL